MPRDRRLGALARWPVVAALVAAVLACWIVGTPPNAGPDEPAHAVASAALVRGDRTGVVSDASPVIRLFEVPGMVGAPSNACYALQPTQPVTCVLPADLDTSPHVVGTTSFNYPPFAYVLPGLASFVPWPGLYQNLARALGAILSAALLVAAVLTARQHSVLASTALLLGTTPIAWFSSAVINPSGPSIAAGAALWAAMLFGRSQRRDVVLLLAGWTVLVLSRRDGPLWATLIVVVACAAVGTRPSTVFVALPRSARGWLVLVSLLPLLQLFDPLVQRGQAALCLAPLLLLPAELLIRSTITDAPPGFTPRKLLIVAGAGLAATVLAVVSLIALRPTVWPPGLVSTVISATGEHLRQLVGVLGSLDAPVPSHAVTMWWIAFGACIGASLIGRQSSLPALLAAAVVPLAVVVAWVLELGSGDFSGSYWQGRYSVPLTIGAPMLAVMTAGTAVGARRLTVALAAVSWWVWNAAFVAAQRRWAVGVEGPLSPRAWDTWGAPLPPLVLCVAHALVSAALLIVVTTPRATRLSDV
jgi:hypothetical protein